MLDGKLDDLKLDDPTVLCVRIRISNTSREQATSTARLLLAADTAKGREVLRFERGPRAGCHPGWAALSVLVPNGRARAGCPRSRWPAVVARPCPGAAHDVHVWCHRSHWTKRMRLLLCGSAISPPTGGACALTGEGAHGARRAPGHAGAVGERFPQGPLEAPAGQLLQGAGFRPPARARRDLFLRGLSRRIGSMMINDLDRRGYHREAERCLESFLHYQGTVKMPEISGPPKVCSTDRAATTPAATTRATAG